MNQPAARTASLPRGARCTHADPRRVSPPKCRSRLLLREGTRATLPNVDMKTFDHLATSFEGVRRTSAGGLARWQYQGRLVARELDATHVVVRVPFDVRDALLQQHPDVFSVPSRFKKHMMICADLDAGDDGAVEDAVESAWRHQARVSADPEAELDHR